MLEMDSPPPFKLCTRTHAVSLGLTVTSVDNFYLTREMYLSYKYSEVCQARRVAQTRVNKLNLHMRSDGD